MNPPDDHPRLTGVGSEGELAHYQFTSIERWFEGIHDDLLEVKGLAQATNGRVRTLEIRFAELKAELRGAKRAVSWVPPLFTAVAASVVSVLLAALFLH